VANDKKTGSKEITTEPEDDLTARQARIRHLNGRAREKARERKRKGKNGPSYLVLDEARLGVFICKRDRYGTSILRVKGVSKGK
jgi:hypothetical protein